MQLFGGWRLPIDLSQLLEAALNLLDKLAAVNLVLGAKPIKTRRCRMETI